jgi:hypothetical protein
LILNIDRIHLNRRSAGAENKSFATGESLRILDLGETWHCEWGMA